MSRRPPGLPPHQPAEGASIRGRRGAVRRACRYAPSPGDGRASRRGAEPWSRGVLPARPGEIVHDGNLCPCPPGPLAGKLAWASRAGGARQWPSTRFGEPTSGTFEVLHFKASERAPDVDVSGACCPACRDLAPPAKGGGIRRRRRRGSAGHRALDDRYKVALPRVPAVLRHAPVAKRDIGSTDTRNRHRRRAHAHHR